MYKVLDIYKGRLKCKITSEKNVSSKVKVTNYLKLNKYIYCSSLALNTAIYKMSKTKIFCHMEILW